MSKLNKIRNSPDIRILIGGGLFLLAKSTREIHNKLEGSDGHANTKITPVWSLSIYGCRKVE